MVRGGNGLCIVKEGKKNVGGSKLARSLLPCFILLSFLLFCMCVCLSLSHTHILSDLVFGCSPLEIPSGSHTCTYNQYVHVYQHPFTYLCETGGRWRHLLAPLLSSYPSPFIIPVYMCIHNNMLSLSQKITALIPRPPSFLSLPTQGANSPFNPPYDM